MRKRETDFLKPKMRGYLRIAVLLAGVAGMPTLSHAGIVTVPAGLPVGTQYRLVFVTYNTYQATSITIGDYNTDVGYDVADSAQLTGLAVSWDAIVSTATNKGIDNIGDALAVPVYNLAGQEVAAGVGGSGLCGGALTSPIDVDEYGNTDSPTQQVWTGSGYACGNGAGNTLGLSTPFFGYAGSITYNGWIQNLSTNPVTQDTTYLPLYAISGILTVASPEPHASLLILLGGVVMILLRRPLYRGPDTMPR